MKRLNVKLLIWMIVISGVALGLIVGLHEFQVARNSGTYLKLAEQAEAEKKYAEAVSFYGQYLQHHQDDAKVTGKYAMLLADLAEQPEGAQMLLPAIGALQKTLQSDDKNTEIRGRLAKIMMRSNRIDDAVAHLEILRKQEPEKAEWESLLGQCRIFVGKFAEALDLYLAAIAHAPTEIANYRQAAALQRQHLNDKEAMNKTLDEMIAANPESALAHLVRYEFYKVEGRNEDATADLNRALELDPKDLNVLLLAAESAVAAQDLAKAKELLESAAENHPDNFRPYLNLAVLERRQQRNAEALAYLDRGLKALPKSPELKMAQWEMLLGDKNLSGAYQAIDEMQKLGVAPELLERMRAQTLLADRKPTQALRALNQIRPRLTAAQLLIPVDLLRAQCYEALGQTDLQIEAYRAVLFNDQNNRPARLGLALAQSRSGQTEEAVEELTALDAGGDLAASLSLLQVLMSQQMRRPAAERDWTRCDELLKTLTEKLPDSEQIKTLQAEYLIQKGDFNAAREVIAKQQQETPKAISPWMARIDLASLEGGVDAAQKELDAAKEALGEIPNIRTAQIGIWLRKGDDASKQSLEEMADNLNKVPEDERNATRQQLANAFNLLGDRKRAFTLFEQVADANPNDLMSRLNAFRVARDTGDNELMQKSLDQIKELVGSNNSYWQYGEAARILSSVTTNKKPASDLDAARKLIDSALAQRPNWGPLHSLLGEIDQRQGNIDAAILNYERAFELGEQSANTVRSLVLLLVLRNRAADAEKVVNSIPRAREILGPKVNAMIDLVLGRQAEGVEAAKQAVELGKDDYSTQLWYANVMDRTGNHAEAEKAYRKALELADNVPDVWLAMINHYVLNKNLDAANKTIAEADAKLGPEKKERVMATAYTLTKDYAKAEPLYMAALKKTPDDLNLLRQVANFYLESGQPQQLVEALKHLLSRADAAGAPGDGHTRWARRTLTQVLASSKSPADVRNALNFIDKQVPRLKLDADDEVLKANMLSLLPDGDSRRQAIELLSGIIARDPKRLQEQITLAQLYNRSADWQSAKGTMLEVLKQRPDDPNLMLVYAEMLLANDESTEAADWLAKYEKTGAEKSPAFTALNARLLAAQDKPEEAIAAARSLVAPPLVADKVPQLKRIAAMLEQFAGKASNPEPYYEAAGAMYRDYVKEVPDESMVLAEFLGKHGDLDEAFAICEAALQKETTESALRSGLIAARARSNELTDERKQRIQGWFDKALKDKPNDPMVLLLLADYNDLLANYDESARIYRTLLSNKDLNGAVRATVLNNLAYLLAVKDNKGEDAWPLIEEAIQLVGPVSELLDTRGMVQLSRGNTDLAVQDMRRSVGDRPTAVKLFHLAHSQLKAGDEEGAGESFRQAMELGLKPEDISTIERASYDELRNKFPGEPVAKD